MAGSDTVKQAGLSKPTRAASSDVSEVDRVFWLAMRRCLLLGVDAIEKRWGVGNAERRLERYGDPRHDP